MASVTVSHGQCHMASGTWPRGTRPVVQGLEVHGLEGHGLEVHGLEVHGLERHGLGHQYPIPGTHHTQYPIPGTHHTQVPLYPAWMPGTTGMPDTVTVGPGMTGQIDTFLEARAKTGWSFERPCT